MRAIAANEGRYPISAQCRLLGVARSTYYSMRSRADRPAAPDPAAPAVVAAHAASKGRYGPRKIKAPPGRPGAAVSRRRVCRIMRENGPVSAYGRKRFKVHPGAVNEADVPNVVARGFGGRAPRTHICSDPTYVRVGVFFTTTKFRISRLISFGFHRFAKVPHPFFANCPIFPSSRLPRTFCSARRTQPADHDA